MKPVIEKVAWPFAGLIGGMLFWYAAHEAGFYLSPYHCDRRWVEPVVQLAGLLGAMASGYLSLRALNAGDRGDEPFHFAALIGCGAAAIFSLVIAWHALATIVYQSCAR